MPLNDYGRLLDRLGCQPPLDRPATEDDVYEHAKYLEERATDSATRTCADRHAALVEELREARRYKAAFFDELGAVLEGLGEDPDGAPYAQESARKMRARAERAEALLREVLDRGDYPMKPNLHARIESALKDRA